MMVKGERIWLTAKGAGRGKHKTIQVDKRHETFSFEYSLRHSANPTQQHRITIQQPINNQQKDIRECRNGDERQEGKHQSTEDCNKTNHKTTNTLHIHHQSPTNIQIDALKN